MKKFTTIILLLLSSLLLHAFSAGAAGRVLLQDIAFSGPSNLQERIILQLDGPAAPKVFALKSGSPRIVFDFPDTMPSIALQNTLQTNGSIVQQIRTGIHAGTPPVTRVVLDLAALEAIQFDHRFDQTDNTLTIIVYGRSGRPTPGGVATNAGPGEILREQAEEPAPVLAVPEKKIAAQAPPEQESSMVQKKDEPAPSVAVPGDLDKNKNPILESVEFDNSSNRGEMVIFKLNAFYPPVVFGIEEDNPRVVCDFKKTRAMPSVPNSIEAKGKYVRSIRIGKHYDPDKVRVVLDLAPNSYDLQQVFFKEDNLFVIIINTLENVPPAEEISKPLKR